MTLTHSEHRKNLNCTTPAFLFCCYFVLVAEWSHAQIVLPGPGIINTVAGDGTAGYSGDGGAATAAELNLPLGVAIDSAGNIYIADTGNNCIREVAASTAKISTFAGKCNTHGFSGDGGPATSAEFTGPAGLAIDSAGNVYIADTDNNRIRAVNTGTTAVTIAGIVIQPNDIATIAGGGTPCSGKTDSVGDGCAATNATLNNPFGVAVDKSGNIYIADTVNERIRKVTASTGIITTVAGNGTGGFSGDGGSAVSAELNSPEGVALDSAGDIYIADLNNNRIREVSGGNISTVAGGGSGCIGQTDSVGDGCTAAQAVLSEPFGVVLDASSNIYIGDLNHNRIREVAAGTRIIFTVAGTGMVGYSGDGGPAGSAKLNVPEGVALDKYANIYIADNSNNRVRVVGGSPPDINTAAGDGTSGYSGDGGPATNAELRFPTGVTLDGTGNVYIGDEGNDRIRVVNTGATAVTIVGVVIQSKDIATIAGGGTPCSGKTDSVGDGCTATSAELNSPSGVAVDNAGNIYIADIFNERIRKVTASTGIISTVAGNGTAGYSGDGEAATSAELYLPDGIALDSAGNIYIADSSNNRVRKVTVSTGIISTVAGNGTAGYNGDGISATGAELNQPNGVAVDSAGNIYIADTNNNRIRKVTVSTGKISTVAGTGTAGYSGDGGQAASAEVSFPSGVTVDGAGNFFIADTNSNRIRKVSASNSVITTVAGNGTTGYGGDGGSATNAELWSPTDIALDSLGSIYIADNGNNRIRVVSY